MRPSFPCLVAALLIAGLPALVRADPVEDFYKGRTIDMTVPGSAGGDYDLRARMVARRLGNHIPGKPAIVVRNMPGGIGIQAGNHLYNAAPRDGATLTIVFTKELIVGASGTGSAAYFYPAALNALAGTKFRIVGGYPGGNEINLAMEKGEVGGRGSNSWASWKSGHPQWLTEKKISILVQIALKRAADLPDVPLMFELAKNDEDRQVLTFLSSDMGIARAFATTPGAPPERVAALRRAFQDMLRDPDFIADTTKAQMEISPSTGEEAQRIAASMLDMPPVVIARAKALIEGPAK